MGWISTAKFVHRGVRPRVRPKITGGGPPAKQWDFIRTQLDTLIRKGRVTATYQRCLVFQFYAEELIALAQKNTLAARRKVESVIRTAKARRLLYESVVPRTAYRWRVGGPGGCTRVCRTYSVRPRDSASMAQLELVDRAGETRPAAPVGARRVLDLQHVMRTGTRAERRKCLARAVRAGVARRRPGGRIELAENPVGKRYTKFNWDMRNVARGSDVEAWPEPSARRDEGPQRLPEGAAGADYGVGALGPGEPLLLTAGNGRPPPEEALHRALVAVVDASRALTTTGADGAGGASPPATAGSRVIANATPVAFAEEVLEHSGARMTVRWGIAFEPFRLPHAPRMAKAKFLDGVWEKPGGGRAEGPVVGAMKRTREGAEVPFARGYEEEGGDGGGGGAGSGGAPAGGGFAAGGGRVHISARFSGCAAAGGYVAAGGYDAASGYAAASSSAAGFAAASLHLSPLPPTADESDIRTLLAAAGARGVSGVSLARSPATGACVGYASVRFLSAAAAERAAAAFPRPLPGTAALVRATLAATPGAGCAAAGLPDADVYVGNLHADLDPSALRYGVLDAFPDRVAAVVFPDAEPGLAPPEQASAAAAAAGAGAGRCPGGGSAGSAGGGVCGPAENGEVDAKGDAESFYRRGMGVGSALLTEGTAPPAAARPSDRRWRYAFLRLGRSAAANAPGGFAGAVELFSSELRTWLQKDPRAAPFRRARSRPVVAPVAHPRDRFADASAIFLRDLSSETTPADVRALLAPFGTVKDVRMVYNKRIAFVELEEAAAAVAALSHLGGSAELRGSAVRLDFGRAAPETAGDAALAGAAALDGRGGRPGGGGGRPGRRRDGHFQAPGGAAAADLQPVRAPLAEPPAPLGPEEEKRWRKALAEALGRT